MAHKAWRDIISAHSTLTPEIKSIFRMVRSVSYTILCHISQEIESLLAADVLFPSTTPFAQRLSFAFKRKADHPRIRADRSTRLNVSPEQHQHPIPMLKTSSVSSMETYSSAGFGSLKMAENGSRIPPLLAINIHQGLYPCNRPFSGVKQAPGIIQQQMDALMAGMDGTARYCDDLVVNGRIINIHKRHLDAIFHRIHSYGFGVHLSAEGRLFDPTEAEAIHKMASPKKINQLCAFLGHKNFYGTFVKNLHSLRAPVNVFFQGRCRLHVNMRTAISLWPHQA